MWQAAMSEREEVHEAFNVLKGFLLVVSTRLNIDKPRYWELEHALDKIHARLCEPTVKDALAALGEISKENS